MCKERAERQTASPSYKITSLFVLNFPVLKMTRQVSITLEVNFYQTVQQVPFFVYLMSILFKQQYHPRNVCLKSQRSTRATKLASFLYFHGQQQEKHSLAVSELVRRCEFLHVYASCVHNKLTQVWPTSRSATPTKLGKFLEFYRKLTVLE